MRKYWGRDNKGFQKANTNRTRDAIHRRTLAGETAKTSKKLADMMDRLYGTNYVRRYHTKGGK